MESLFHPNPKSAFVSVQIFLHLIEESALKFGLALTCHGTYKESANTGFSIYALVRKLDTEISDSKFLSPVIGKRI